jgi:hypothetical protein
MEKGRLVGLPFLVLGLGLRRYSFSGSVPAAKKVW